MPDFKRRDFLKLGLGASSLLALEGYSSLLGTAEGEELAWGGKQVCRTTGKTRHAIPSTCLNCFARCGILGYVDAGRLVKIEGDPGNPNNQGKICAKGQAGINLEYDVDRILYPLRRIGKRGEGKWERISWEKALQEVADRLKTIRGGGNPDEFAFHSERDITTQSFARRFLDVFGSTSILNHTALGGANKKIARQLTWGADIDINDVAYSEYILNFGANPYEAHILRTAFIQRIASTRSIRMVGEKILNKAKLVTFDSRCSITAGRSDEWIPVMPGTDGIVALAMARVIMNEGLYDNDFITKWCNYPVDKLAQHLQPYTPEVAQKISSVPAPDIRRIAREFATAKPATTISAGGVTEHINGVYTERCIALLSAITGNIDIKGGDCLPRTYQFSQPEPIPLEPPRESKLTHPQEFPLAHHMTATNVLSMIKEGRQKISAYMIYQHNPAYFDPECSIHAEILQDEKLIPFFVVIDSYLSESAALADMILPAATYLERLELESPPSFEMVPFISIRQPIVRPLGEAQPFMDILIELARRIGGGMEGYFPFATAEDYWRACISHIAALVKVGGLDYLKEHGVWFDPEAKPNYKSYEKEGFETPSGKFEIYSKILEEKGFNPLPVYEPIPQQQKMKNDQFILITFQENVHTHGYTNNAILLAEITHNNKIWINSDVARARGIKRDDLIEVRSKIGSIKIRAHPTPGIHPMVVAISDSCGHWEYGRIAQAKQFKSEDPLTALLWWEEEGNGIHPNCIIPVSLDPIGGGQAWMDTMVTITKLEPTHKPSTEGFFAKWF